MRPCVLPFPARVLLPILACLLRFTAALDAHGEVYLDVVDDYGAVGNGIIDDTTAITNAIAAAQSHGKTLRFPLGAYLVTAPLTIEAQLIMGLDAGGWPADNLPMPTLLIRHENGPALTMRAGASIHGLAFLYDRGKTPNPKETIRLDGNGLSVTNVRIQYCHDGIHTNPPTNVGRTNLENIFIVAPTGTGVYMTNTLDIPTLRNIEIWNNNPTMFPGPGFHFGRNDEMRMSNCFVLNLEVGMLFEDDPLYAARGERAGTYGSISNTSTDACSIGVRVRGYADLDIAGGHFWNHHDGFDVDSDEAILRIHAAEFSSNGGPALNIRRAESVIIDGCRFQRAFENGDVLSTRFAGVNALIVSDNHFGPFGPCMELGDGLGQAMISNNVFETSDFDKIRHGYNDNPELMISDNIGVPSTASTGGAALKVR